MVKKMIVFVISDGNLRELEAKRFIQTLNPSDTFFLWETTPAKHVANHFYPPFYTIVRKLRKGEDPGSTYLREISVKKLKKVVRQT